METFKKLIASPRYWLALLFTFVAASMQLAVPEESLDLPLWFAVFMLTKLGAIVFALFAYLSARTLFDEWEEND
ncbi:MAG: hypothetical protein ACI3X6_05255 [Alloprevotella sp.]